MMEGYIFGYTAASARARGFGSVCAMEEVTRLKVQTGIGRNALY